MIIKYLEMLIVKALRINYWLNWLTKKIRLIIRGKENC